MSEEIWKEVPGSSGYCVSDLGRVRAPEQRTRFGSGFKIYPARILGQSGDGGYHRINIRRKSYNAHRLVAAAFIPNPHGLKCVNHKNGVKNDNRVINLEWCTDSENNLHKTRVLGKQRGSFHPMSKLTEEDIPLIFKLRGKGMSLKEIGGLFGVCLSLIGRVLKRQNWSHVSL